MSRARGIDISYWGRELQLKGNLDFIIHRLAYGMWVDPRLDMHAKASVDVPVREGYIYYRVGQPWYEQVKLAIRLAEKYDLVNVWWDAETDQWGNTFGRKFINETAEGLRKLREVFPNAGLYCNRNIYYLLEYHLGDSWLNRIPLWLADPQHDKQIEYFMEAGQPKWYDFRKFKRPEGSWHYWQTSFLGDPVEYGVLGKKAVDENVYNGTLSELKELYGIAKKGEETQTKPVCPTCGQELP